MHKDEARRECQREFQPVMKPTGMSTILHIEVLSNDNKDEMVKITDRDEMERTMMTNFKQKFLEVYDTNTTIEPLSTWLGTDRMTKTAEEILQGNFTFPL